MQWLIESPAVRAAAARLLVALLAAAAAAAGIPHLVPGAVECLPALQSSSSLNSVTLAASSAAAVLAQP